jgi:hypothetical protein
LTFAIAVVHTPPGFDLSRYAIVGVRPVHTRG